jgi:hypothetical protein
VAAARFLAIHEVPLMTVGVGITAAILIRRVLGKRTDTRYQYRVSPK